MIAVGNNELGKELGKTAKCPACSRELDVQSTGPLNTVKCSCGEGEVYLIGMNGREINQSTPDHTEDKLDKIKGESVYPSIREYNGMLHRFAMDILLKNSNAMIQGEFNPTITAIRYAYDIAQHIITVGENYEFDEYNGIDSLRSNQAEEEV